MDDQAKIAADPEEALELLKARMRATGCTICQEALERLNSQHREIIRLRTLHVDASRLLSAARALYQVEGLWPDRPQKDAALALMRSGGKRSRRAQRVQELAGRIWNRIDEDLEHKL